MSQQKGVFRVNCIDSLDRTNVVEVNISTTALYEVLTITVVVRLRPTYLEQATRRRCLARPRWATYGDGPRFQ